MTGSQAADRRGKGERDVFLVDIDGTLIDSNYQHALAWSDAFRSVGVTVPIWRIHQAIGMGGDQLVTHVSDGQVERQYGDAIRERWEDVITPQLRSIAAFEGARETLQALKDRGRTLVAASSGKPEHVAIFLDTVGAADLFEATVSSEDIEESKPAPDVLEVALQRVGLDTDTDRAVVLGDSLWDVEAADKLGLPVIATLGGGFCADALVERGATRVITDLRELIDNDQT